jgi:hypothetical protein
MSPAWLLCSYKLPRQPSRLRLAVWRRLRRIGALMLHDGLWTLPADAKTREDFDWLAEEIEERGGRAMLWESRSLDPAQDAAIAGLFRAEADQRYAALGETARQLDRVARRKTLSAQSLERVAQRLRTLDRAFRLERRRDYFRAPGRAPAEAEIQAAMELLRTRTGSRARPGRLRAVGN